MEDFCRPLSSICTFLPKITSHTRVDLVHIRLITDKINTDETFLTQSNKFDFVEKHLDNFLCHHQTIRRQLCSSLQKIYKYKDYIY